MGWIAAQAGVGEAFVVGGLACVAVGVGAIVVLRRSAASVPDPSAPRPSTALAADARSR
jgi:hypothetical protein